MRILFVHSNESMALSVSKELRHEGHQVIHFRELVDAESLVEFCRPDFCVLELHETEKSQLHAKDSVEALNRYGVRAVFCSTHAGEKSQILAQILSMDIMIYAVDDVRRFADSISHALVRRSQCSEPATDFAPLNRDFFHLDPSLNSVRFNGHEIVLTSAEFRVLQCLTQQPRSAVSRRDLAIQALIKTGNDDRVIDVHIASLRAKLGRAHAVIRTVRNLGYAFMGDVRPRDAQESTGV